MEKKFDDTNRGSIWHNTRKRPDKKDPDYTGSLNVDGHQFYVDAWKSTSDNPKAPILNFRVKRKDSVHPKDYDTSRPASTQEKPVQGDSGASGGGFEDSEIPFNQINWKLP